jgi:hypothetical protein
MGIGVGLDRPERSGQTERHLLAPRRSYYKITIRCGVMGEKRIKFGWKPEGKRQLGRFRRT